MNCKWVELERLPDGGIRYFCEICGRGNPLPVLIDRAGHFPDRIYWECEKDKSFGPGTALHRLIQQLGFSVQEACGCEGMIANMNKWGAEGCRGEHRQEITERLEKKRSEANLIAKTKAAAFALAKGLPLSIPELLELAIQQSEQSQLRKEDLCQTS